MKANYKARLLPGLVERNAVTLNAKGERLVAMTWAEAQRQFDIERQRVTETILASVLCVLNDEKHWTGKTLTPIYKKSVEKVAGLRFDLRGDAEMADTMNPVTEELVAMIEQLRGIGLDIRKLENSCHYDHHTGEVTWDD